MIVLATLLLGHLLADFPLQTNKIFQLKNKGLWGLLLHVAIHLIIMAFLIVEPGQNWSLFLALGLSHLIIDSLKVYRPTKPQAPGFIIDQIAHIFVLVLLVLFAPTFQVVEITPYLFYPALIGAVLSAITMYVWVWANDRAATVDKDDLRVKWAQKSMIKISQQSGRVIVISLILASLFII